MGSAITGPRTVLVTGANRGLGLGIARGLARLGHRVLMACRDCEGAVAAREAIACEPAVRKAGGTVAVLDPLDLGSLASIRAFSSGLEQRALSIDVLVNNAGVFCPERQTTADGFERCLGVNFLGSFLLSRLLLPRLSPGARVVNVSSVVGLWGHFDPGNLDMESGYGPFRAYARSKFAIILGTLELAERCAGRVKANAVHPGVVNTRILTMRRWYDPLADRIFRPLVLDIDAGAAPVLELACGALHEETTGQYFSRHRLRKLGPRMLDATARKELWDIASGLVGLDPECL